MIIPMAGDDSGDHRRPTRAMGFLCVVILLVLGPSAAAAQQSGNGTSSGGKNGSYNNLYNFNPSMAIIIVVLISAFFFLGFFSIYIRNCSGSGGGGAAAAVARAGGALGISRRQRGLDAELLQTFPTLVYSEVKGLKIGKAALECAVCLCEFEDEDTLRLLPACSHVFHPDCIDAWLASHVTCPVCRANLSNPPPNPAAGETASDSPAPAHEDTSSPEFVAIRIDEPSSESGTATLLTPPELVELRRLTSHRQSQRSKSIRRPSRFPRSHSTGHSIVQQEENADRYTLRLPEHIRKEIVAVGRLQRTKSFPANSPAAAEGSSTRRGLRWGSVGGFAAEEGSRAGRSVRLGRMERWPSVLMRTISSRVPAWAMGRKPDGESGSVKKNSPVPGAGASAGGGLESEGSTKGKVGPLRGPYDSASGRADVDASDTDSTNESPTLPFARV